MLTCITLRQLPFEEYVRLLTRRNMPFKSDSSDVALSIWSDATRATLERMQLGCAVVVPDLTGATYPGASASKPSVRALPPPTSSAPASAASLMASSGVRREPPASGTYVTDFPTHDAWLCSSTRSLHHKPLVRGGRHSPTWLVAGGGASQCKNLPPDSRAVSPL